jgi:hypothetical protein
MFLKILWQVYKGIKNNKIYMILIKENHHWLFVLKDINVVCLQNLCSLPKLKEDLKLLVLMGEGFDLNQCQKDFILLLQLEQVFYLLLTYLIIY